METTHLSSTALTTASDRRDALKSAVSSVERAAASPSGMPSWPAYVLRELGHLREALDHHVTEVEGPHGLLPEMLQTAPRLAAKIDLVRDEHPMLRTMVAETIALAESGADPEELRASIVDTLIAIVRHRQHGADLVFDCYNVDIGGG